METQINQLPPEGKSENIAVNTVIPNSGKAQLSRSNFFLAATAEVYRSLSTALGDGQSPTKAKAKGSTETEEPAPSSTPNPTGNGANGPSTGNPLTEVYILLLEFQKNQGALTNTELFKNIDASTTIFTLLAENTAKLKKLQKELANLPNKEDVQAYQKLLDELSQLVGSLDEAEKIVDKAKGNLAKAQSALASDSEAENAVQGTDTAAHNAYNKDKDAYAKAQKAYQNDPSQANKDKMNAAKSKMDAANLRMDSADQALTYAKAKVTADKEKVAEAQETVNKAQASVGKTEEKINGLNDQLKNLPPGAQTYAKQIEDAIDSGNYRALDSDVQKASIGNTRLLNKIDKLTGEFNQVVAAIASENATIQLLQSFLKNINKDLMKSPVGQTDLLEKLSKLIETLIHVLKLVQKQMNQLQEDQETSRIKDRTEKERTDSVESNRGMSAQHSTIHSEKHTDHAFVRDMTKPEPTTIPLYSPPTTLKGTKSRLYG